MNFRHVQSQNSKPTKFCRMVSLQKISAQLGKSILPIPPSLDNYWFTAEPSHYGNELVRVFRSFSCSSERSHCFCPFACSWIFAPHQYDVGQDVLQFLQSVEPPPDQTLRELCALLYC